MEDKAIIIEGVDVAGCEFFDNYECNIYVNEYWEPQDNTKDMCKWHENCYYKQLKRSEQENLELKAENERLKEKIIKLSEEKGHLIVENNTLKEENFNFEEIVKLCRCEQYEQTLQEIKKICKMDCGDCQYNQDCDCNFEECEEAKIDDILDLITKAESEEV